MGLFNSFKRKEQVQPEGSQRYVEASSIFYYVGEYRQVELVPCENFQWLTDISMKANDPDREGVKLIERNISTLELENIINPLDLDRIQTVLESDGQTKQEQRDCIALGKSHEAIFYNFKDNVVQYIWFIGHWSMNKMKLANFLHEIGIRWNLLLQDDNLQLTIDLKNRVAIDDYLHQYDIKKLSDVKEDEEFWRGTKIRVMLKNDDDDYYSTQYFDYMLVQTHDDHDHMILVNITSGNYKEGAVFVNKVELEKSIERTVVTKKSLQIGLGQYFEDCYLLTK